jgi:predicted O-methyltransferase YrrM
MIEEVNLRNLGDLMAFVRSVRTFGKQKGIGLRASPEWDYPILYTIARMYLPKVIIESGTNIGLSAVAWAFGSGAHVHTWDVEDFDVKAETYTNIGNMIHRHLGGFESAPSSLLSSHVHKKLVFIDGDHTEKGVLQDYNKIKPYLYCDDILVFHDTRKKGVKRALEEIRPNLNYQRSVAFDTVSGITLFVVSHNA